MTVFYLSSWPTWGVGMEMETEIVSEKLSVSGTPWLLGTSKTKLVTARRGDSVRVFAFKEHDEVTIEDVDAWWDYAEAMQKWTNGKPRSPNEMKR